MLSSLSMQLRPWHGVVLVAVLLGLVHALFYDWPFEDSYITFRYADNLVEGIGLRYNPGETVEGFTSFGWVVILAGAGFVGLPIPVVAKVLAAAAGLVLVALTCVMARRWTKLPTAYVAAPGVLVAANGTWAYYAMTGMETAVFALVIAAAAWVIATRTDARAAQITGVILAGACMLRPEGMGYAGLFGAVLLTDRDGRRQLAHYVAAFCIVFVPYFVWKWQHFGYPVPNTFYAKASPSGGVMRAGMHHVEEYFTTHAYWLALPAAGLLLARVRERWARLCCILLAGAAINAIVVGGDAFAFYRFLLPGLPFGAIALFAGGQTAGQRIIERRPDIDRSVRALGIACSVALIAFTAMAPLRSRTSLTRTRPETQRGRALKAATINDHYFKVGRFLRETFEPDTLIATNAAGIIPYEARLPTIDMLGLNDEHIAHLDIELGHGALGHEKHDGAYVLSREPDVILLGLPVLIHRPLQSPAELQKWFGQWFAFLPGDREIFFDKEFRANYAPVSVPVEDAGWLTMFVRKGSEPNRLRR